MSFARLAPHRPSTRTDGGEQWDGDVLDWMCIGSSRRSRSGRTAGSATQARSSIVGEALRVFADSLGPEDEIAIEATCNTHAIVRAARVAGGAGDRVEPDEDQGDRGGESQDRQGRRRGPRRAARGRLSAVGVGCRRGDACVASAGRAARATRAPAHPAQEPGAGDPHRNLVERCPFSICSASRAALARRAAPSGDEEQAVDALLRQLDFHGQELRIIDAALGRIALERRMSSG